MPFPKTPAEFREAGYKADGSGSCRGCGAFIWWVRTPKGKRIPLNVDLTPHWETCPKAEEFRKEKQ